MKKLKFKKNTGKKTEREKVEERREEVLAKGRKFKYPLQYSKHKMMLVTIILAVLALAAVSGLGYLAFYKAQTTSDIAYRITRYLPLPVAEIDGASVRYSDYLMIYRSTIKPVEQQGQFGQGQDAEAMKAHYKREALTKAEDYTYAEKMAKEMGIEVSGEEIDEEITKHRKVGGVERSEESFAKILEDNFGLSLKEYRRMMELSLLKVKVAEAMDKTAKKVAEEVEQKLKNGFMVKDGAEIKEDGEGVVKVEPGDMVGVAGVLDDAVLYEETGGVVDRMNVDGGRAAKAMEMEVGQVSERFVSGNGDGYYFVKLINKTDEGVDYVSIKIPFKELNNQVKKLREEGKVKEHIELSE